MASETVNKHVKAREQLLGTLKEDLVGPAQEGEKLTEAPTTRYASGVLFPRKKDEDAETDAERGNAAAGDGKPLDEEEADGLIEQTSSFYPSAMGLSFIVGSDCDRLNLSLSAGRYERITEGDYPVSVPLQTDDKLPADPLVAKFLDHADGRLSLNSAISPDDKSKLLDAVKGSRAFRDGVFRVAGFSEQGWKRIPVQSDIQVELTEPRSEYEVPGEHLRVVVTSKEGRTRDDRICTATVVNTEYAERELDNDKTYFQVGLSLKGGDADVPFKAFSEAAPPLGSDPEDASLQLLYRNRQFYAAGHGTSAAWTLDEGSRTAKAISTDNLPTHMVPDMELETLPGVDRQPNLSMRHMAADTAEEVVKDLGALIDAYAEWITQRESELAGLEEPLASAGKAHLDLCREAEGRMRAAIQLLKEDVELMRCFQLANKAMLMQRVHSRVQSKKRLPDDPPPTSADYDTDEHRWRPFQIAFILLNIESVADPKAAPRDLVDLIWFPTGGGKTEAYLGLTALTIFMRRSRHEHAGGTTVLMRYTLRLLTSQQFQRACTLICACEKLRRDGEVGGDEISIGQWLGMSSSPNTIGGRNGAEKKYEALITQRDGTGNNPFQILSCPWCGTYMVRKEGRGSFGYSIKSRPKRFVMSCTDRNCDFADLLPIKIVDEDIYRDPPTLLFGTVDKFAMLPWKADASSIFALDKDNPNPSPELIIQDELHLISGALGTMVGLYESAIDMLCTAKGVRPKIIASTATIRRSADQCKALYAREVRQFPSPGLDASDSFFAHEAPPSDEKPGRMYAGVMPAGKTSTATEVRLLADCLQGAALLDVEDSVKDHFWTQVVYCNSIRELGTSKSVMYDDVKEYGKRLSDRLGMVPRYYSDKDVQELTGRKSAEAIPEILQRVEVSHPADEAIDVLLATNMISVGVDVDRLGLMVILGQPKTTSEYIQASSRVGRKHAGLVVTLYSPVKSRDRSHFEQFRKYHQALYRYVEPTSVTPFSPPVREKALRAVVVTLMRHLLGHAKNDTLPDFDASSPEVQQMVETLVKRAREVDPTEAETTDKELREILDTITSLQKEEAGISYDPQGEKNPLLRKPGDDARARGIFPIPLSMRSTDAECFVTMDFS